ncbi:MAG TPA: carboxypeptidase M32 [Polyangiaceae bacterium]|nr:carboxypeptidase M32 [Polyangiaceae bacterium]
MTPPDWNLADRTLAYQKLEDHQRKVGDIDHACAILDWDQAVIMPAKAGASRADALSTLRGLRHQLATAPELESLLGEAQVEAGKGLLDDWQRANLNELSQQYRRALCVPRDLVEASSRAEAHSEQAWRALRAKNDWASFLPYLQEVVSLKRQTAQALADALHTTPYDALVDGFEAGITQEQIDGLFNDLRGFLPQFLQACLSKQAKDKVVELHGPFPIALQKQLGERLMAAIGFDFTIGRLDVSHHPFCGGLPRDVRVTTRYKEGDFTSSLMGVLHETGHAKYEQGLPDRWLGQPVGAARGMATHESQSLFTEMLIARSPAFLKFAAPLIAQTFSDEAASQAEGFSAHNLYTLGTRVRPGFIRVDADEVTYPSHIILRYEIERDLIAGKLQVAEIPDAWGALLQELLGLSVAGNYRDGCMQDVHWPAGLFGYFPLYTLGALIAAQLQHALARELPDLNRQIASGHFKEIDDWLRAKIWSQGSLLPSHELLMRATGEPLSTRDFKAHLQARYLDDRE